PSFFMAKSLAAVTGRCFGDKDFRGGLENGILLCELLSCIKPGLVKKINRLPTPIAGLDNLSVFLRGCEELGLKGSQLFDPGDLQDTSTRPTAKGSDCSRKLKNVLITIYWLGRAANGCTSYNGPTLDLKEFEALLSQMRKEAEEAESPKRSIRDSGYIDCWDSERSDSLSPPRHGREDSFDSLDSFGSRSRQTPSPDVLVARGSSDGRGSDSESDGAPHRKMPDVRKDDMSARRTSVSEPRTAMPFNQYLPNKSNQSGYVPTPLRKKKNDKDEGGRKSWSTATSPIGGDRPFRMMTRHQYVLVCFAFCSTPARSCSEEFFHHSTTLAANTAATAVVATSPVITGKRPPLTEQEEAPVRKGIAGAPLVTERDEKRARQMLTSPKHVTTLCSSHFLPVPAAVTTTTTATSDTGRRKGRARSESEDPQGGMSWLDSNLSATSVSMIDMRGEDEAVLQPHSQVRHELMHNQYNKMKEEDDHWQDDLARWKNRRRSISQDLIKKEEQRKMMERLMSGEPCISERRRSIKTYREIVEDKERREEELRDAYRRARTPEEASAILQRYAQRFSISDAVLERLQLPKLLDRSISADPSFPYPNGPMRYLRQQSAPAPKFTSTLEARIEEFPKDSSHQRPQIRSRSSEPPSTRGLSPKPVPLLTPKPYFQSRPTVADPWPSKVRLTLKHFNSTVDAPSSAASPTRSPHASTGGESPVATKAEEAQGGTEPASKDVQEEKVIEHSTPPIPVLPQARRGDRWSWDPDEERKRQERWQQEQERMLQEKYRREQEKLKEEWEKAQREVAEEERKYHEEERRILEETVTPLTPRSSALPSPSRGELSFTLEPQDTIVRSLADWERKQQLLERQSCHSFSVFISLSPSCRSVSGKKLCSSCGQPLGKGAAMIIETLSLYFHIQCFKCGVCKGQLGDTTTGTDVRIRNGLLNCHQCYIRSRSAGQPTTL
uniref:LIM and calponin homology domains 1b n=1 Tax=Dicentrarchus labrax TaxID=13489 RepID=A0A8C4F1G5_DICLA